MANHTCAHCGNPFVSRRSVATYCTMTCRNLEYKRRGPAHPGTFASGNKPVNHVPVGTVKIRVRHKRNNETRAFVKVAEPNVWELRARLVWQQANGPIPSGMIVHHINRDTLNDSIENLALAGRGEHLIEHRPEFETKRATAASLARWGHDATSSKRLA